MMPTEADRYTADVGDPMGFAMANPDTAVAGAPDPAAVMAECGKALPGFAASAQPGRVFCGRL